MAISQGSSEDIFKVKTARRGRRCLRMNERFIFCWCMHVCCVSHATLHRHHAWNRSHRRSWDQNHGIKRTFYRCNNPEANCCNIIAYTHYTWHSILVHNRIVTHGDCLDMRMTRHSFVAMKDNSLIQNGTIVGVRRLIELHA